MKCEMASFTEWGQYKFDKLYGYGSYKFADANEVFYVILKSDTDTFYTISRIDNEGVYHGRNKGSLRDGHGL
jgi:hypothetical protein